MATANATAVALPLLALLPWIVGTAVVAHGSHRVSGATGLTMTPGTKGTNGVPSGARASVASTRYGFAKAYTANGLPAGLALGLVDGVFSGTPTKTGFSTSA